MTRISDGSTRLERAISTQAYAAYARARLQERKGDARRATASYHEVLRLDSAADEAWIRLGVLACGADMAAANRAFARAEKLNAKSASLFQARAHCSLLHRNFDSALATAQAALRFAPDDPEASHLVIRVQLARGNYQEALRYAWSHVAIFPNDTHGWLTLATIVTVRSSMHAQVLHRAAERTPSQYSYATFPHSPLQRPAPSLLDHAARSRLDFEHALVTADIRAVHHAARELGLGTLELMSRAYELGALEFAHGQATLAGQIQPDDPRIWQERLRLADLLRGDGEFDQLIEQAPRVPTGSSSIEWGPLLDLVRRRTGVDLSPKPVR